MSVSVIENPIEDIYTVWKTAMVAVVGAGNVSADMATTAASTPYARIFMMQNPTADSDLEGNECATTLSFQVEIYTSGNKALDKAYRYDATSHQAMMDMGFRRTYGASLIESTDSNVKRLVSRYSMLYTG